MGWLGTVFSKQQAGENQDYAVLSADIHSHLIPGIDDGAATLEDSLEMIRGLAGLGFKKIITTPHIMSDYFRNNPEIIREGLEKLRQAVAEEAIPLSLEAAAEYMFDDGFERIFRQGELLTFGKKCILVELSTYTPPPNLRALLFELEVAGYTTVLAHVERYGYWFDDVSHIEELKHHKLLVQVNTISFTGNYSPRLKRNAIKLAEAGLIDLLGSDLHSAASLPLLAAALQEPQVQMLLSSGKLLNNQL